MENIVCSYTLSISNDVFESLCEELGVSSEVEVVAFYKRIGIPLGGTVGF